MKSRMLLETGYPGEARVIAENLLSNQDQLGTVKMGTLVVMITIKMRNGNQDILPFLHETKKLIFKTQEHQRIIPLVIAMLQYEWLTAKEVISEAELRQSVLLAERVDNIILNSEFDFWLKKARKVDLGLKTLYEPFQFLKEKKIKSAASFWQKKHCLFEQALMLFEGNENDKKAALSIFQQLEAHAVCEKIKMEMRAAGIRKIPRGKRESTKSNPMNLTNRELEILQLLQKGKHNKEIADFLFISTKTVDHHISNILLKLDVNSRSKAVIEAARLNILK